MVRVNVHCPRCQSAQVYRHGQNPKGNCYDNAPMESFWGTLKNESLSHYHFNTRNEAISVIREYIEIFHNRQRRHSRLGNTSPAAFRKKYYQIAA
ncbi:hypothetical protein AA471_25755 [Salmonella enterica subsp. enterica]|nr:hypothetical protein [Salmonella enterica subsp. enterica]ECI0980649.1 IS3 family transposase [Salmonella enterica subsp. enterica serovar Newport]ECO0901730.1 IS3 family transposase [Salmonella enterica subsp. enterica serovar Newport]ECO1013368.1 IS3 family transposase [Salmonella enterica subsp. enterica serovar Newport]EDQ2991660.1 IS3 family transposase [Salmonella enterica subsp. enterica]